LKQRPAKTNPRTGPAGKPDEKAWRQPTFSVIIPTRNPSAVLDECLTGLHRSDYPSDHFEVIVVDDGSETSPAIEEALSGFNVKLIKQAQAGPAIARNTGAAAATGEILAFIDDDCIPAPDWLPVLSAYFTTARGCAIGGGTVNGRPENVYSTANQTLNEYLCDYFNTDPECARFLTSNNLAIKATDFQAIGGFDGSFPRAAGEDRELCDRWMHNGGRLIYAAEARVRHKHGMTLWSFWRKHFNYGRGALRYHRVRAARNRDRIRLEPWRFYWNLIRHPFSKGPKSQAALISGLLILSQVANAAGFSCESVLQFQRIWRSQLHMVDAYK
jgi:GT2 family glycosyltransferase